MKDKNVKKNLIQTVWLSISAMLAEDISEEVRNRITEIEKKALPNYSSQFNLDCGPGSLIRNWWYELGSHGNLEMSAFQRRTVYE